MQVDELVVKQHLGIRKGDHVAATDGHGCHVSRIYHEISIERERERREREREKERDRERKKIERYICIYR